MNWRETRAGEVLLGRYCDPTRENHVASGFRVVQVAPEGLRVRRINAHYLNAEPVESWVLRWDQLENQGLQLLPEGTQLPLM